MPATKFCGRDNELATLLTAWDRVRSGHGPTIAVLLAESGLGKTRLSHELFSRIVGNSTPTGIPSYWPDSLGIEGNNLQVNPDLNTCAPSATMPFLWWGLRLVDPLSRNCIAAGILSSHYERDLKPHLEHVYRQQRSSGRKSQMFDVGKGFAIDIAADFVPFGGLAKTIGEAALGLGKIYKESRADQAPVDIASIGEERRTTLNETIISDLSAFFTVPDGTPPTPAIIVIDDAQFSAHDPGMVAFTDLLCRTMVERNWPVLLLINHWEREWGVPVADNQPTIAGRLHWHLSQPDLTHDILRLRPISDLGPMIDERLPGLTPPQRDAILTRVDGNPRFLDEILRLATSPRGRAWFEERNPSLAMTEKGLQDLLNRSVALHDLVADRLAESPEIVQQAVALASLQGVEFLNSLIGQTAAQLSTDPNAVTSAVNDAESPHAYVAKVHDGLAAFAQRIYYEVAREHLPSCFDPDEAMQALTDAVRDILANHRYATLNADEYVRFLALVAGLFETSDDAHDRFAAAWALYNQLRHTETRGDIVGGYAVSQRLLAVLDQLDDDQQDSDLRWLRAVYNAAGNLNDWATQEHVLERLLRMTRATYADDANQWSAWMVADMLALAAGFHAMRQDRNATFSALSEALQALAPWPIEEADTTILSTWDDLAFRMASELTELGAFADALRTLEQVLVLADRMRELEPDHGRWRYCRARGEWQRGSVAYKLGDTALARTHLESALQIARDIVAEYPVPVFVTLLIGTLSELAPLVGREGETERSGALLTEALSAARTLCATTDIEDHRDLLAESLMRLALHSDRIGDAALVRHYATEALQVYERNLDAHWAPWAGIGLAHDRLASLDLAADDLDSAHTHITKAIQYGQADAQRADTYAVRGRLLIMLATLVSIERRRGAHDAAQQALVQADTLWESLPESVQGLLKNTRANLDAERA